MYIGDGSRILRDAFELAKQKSPAIIFIDEIDAVGMRRSGADEHGEREVQRTMLELLNQMDGFTQHDKIKVLAATNRIDILDPALLRSGRLDRKIEFPMPDVEARSQILKIHSKRVCVMSHLCRHSQMTVSGEVNYDELARSTDDFNGAMLKAVCVEAGMVALRRNAMELRHEDYMEGIIEVQEKKKNIPHYYT